MQYLVSIMSPLPITVNGTTTTNYTNWVRAGSVLNLTIGNVYLSNDTMFTPSIGNESIVVSSPISMSITWTPYYLVSIESPLPISVNGTGTTNYVGWVAGGSTLVVVTSNVTLDNGTMFKPSITSEVITMDSPVTLSISWTPYYLVRVVSPRASLSQWEAYHELHRLAWAWLKGHY